MDVRTFRAGSMQEALRQVRQQMGLEAVVLQTREVPKRRLWRRWWEVEVTAGLGVKTAPVDADASCHPLRHASAQQASALMDRRTFVPRADSGIDLLSSSRPHPDNAGADDAISECRADGDLLAERLETIESLLTQFSQRAAEMPGENLPQELFEHYAQLIEADVAEAHARDLIRMLQEEIDAGSTDLSRSRPRLAELICSQIECRGPIQVEPGRQRVVALVGPTGVGKTTTIAKLAANFHLRDGVKLGLVTVDTYRVAAVEQLRTYADIIDLPMKVVTNPIEMRRAIDELSDRDLVLIDTAGRSPREEMHLKELRALLAEARCDEVHLVLSLASSPRVLEMTATKFDSVGVTSLLLTKLDETAGMGTLYSVARQIDHPISYFTTGQDVPDDIETADASRATRLILGNDDLFGRSDCTYG